MNEIWLDSYDDDVPRKIVTTGFNSISEFFNEAVAKYGEKTACINFGEKLTYQELDEKAIRLAAYLTQKCHLKKGDRIALMMPNIMQYPICLFAAFKAGLIVVNVNPLYTTREIEYLLISSGALAIIVLENFIDECQNALPQTFVDHLIVTKMGDVFSGMKSWVVNFIVKYIKKSVPNYTNLGLVLLKDIFAQDEGMDLFDEVKLIPEDIAFFQYTGGTTGKPKAVILTHKNIIANMEQCLAWFRCYLKEKNETVVTALPLYHIFSLTSSLFFMAVGATLLLITNPRDVKRFIADLKSTPCSIFIGVNTLFNLLLHNREFRKLNFKKLKLTLAGGMAVQKSVAEEWQAVTKCVVIQGYGLTETSPVVTINPLWLKEFNGSIGLPIPNTEISIRDEENNECAIGQEGELWVRGPQVMQGYWQNSVASHEVLTKEGWLKTGDIARMDNKGFIYIVDRKKDMIIVSGFNVYPNEIEEVLASHPLINEVAVVGEPDVDHGEIVKAFIVRKNKKLTTEQILAYCHEKLTHYKIPKKIVFVKELPKSNIGKVLRRALRKN